MAPLRAFFWRYIMHWETEICEECGGPVGRSTGSWWHADDDLWIEVTEPTSIEEAGRGRRIGNGCLCPVCFTRVCEDKGIHIFWHARVEYRNGQDVEEGQWLAGLRPYWRGAIVVNERNAAIPSPQPFFVVPSGSLSPRRYDEVDEWLRSERDDYPRGSTAWCTIDKLLDNYREKADYGLRLDEPGGDP
jgi:hypothetical protein